MTTTFRPIYLFSLALSFLIPMLFLRYAGEWILKCMAPAWAQWMGSTFFTGTMGVILMGSQAIQRKLAALPDPRLPATDRRIIQRTTFACSAGVLGVLILYIFILMVMILMAYNAPFMAWPYAWLWGVLSIVVFGTCIHLLMISNNVSNRLEEVEEEERQKKKQERREKVDTLLPLLEAGQSFSSTLSFEEMKMILEHRLQKEE